LWKKLPGRTVRCRRRCSNRSKFCATRTGKVVERKRRVRGPDANWKFGSPSLTRTCDPLVNFDARFYCTDWAWVDALGGLQHHQSCRLADSC
jgi:hypothetical protein